MHPADDLRGSLSDKLTGKRIVLGVTGSIAAVETIRLARELIRHGADVIPVMTTAATRIIHPDALEFATGNTPIVWLSGKTEHVSYCGQIPDAADLLLIAPCTANTLSKIALGIDDTPVTTFATTAIGSHIPVMIVPAMHLSMYTHSVVQQNIIKCKNLDVDFIEPHTTGHKAKLAQPEEIVQQVLQKLGPQDLTSKKILIIGGSTAEPIDDIRVLTNISSGKTTIALAQNAFERNSDITLWYGSSPQPAPKHIPTIRYTSYSELRHLIQNHSLSSYDSIIVCAAITDYHPKKQSGKIPSSEKKLSIELTPTQKLLPLIRKKAPHAMLIAFKVNDTAANAKKQGKALLAKYNLDYVIANTLTGFTQDTNEIWVIDKQGDTTHKKAAKNILAAYILDRITTDRKR